MRPEIMAYYQRGEERNRITSGPGRLEYVRTWDVLTRVLPAPPAAVLDVGGATGVYAGPDVLLDMLRTVEEEPSLELAHLVGPLARWLVCSRSSAPTVTHRWPSEHRGGRQHGQRDVQPPAAPAPAIGPQSRRRCRP